MIIEYRFDSQISLEHSPPPEGYNIAHISNITGYLAVKTKVKDIVCESTSILIDLTQIINSLSASAIADLRETSISVLLDLEPAFYIHYGEDITLYEYDPFVESKLPNPPLEVLSRDEAVEIATDLRDRINRHISASNFAMLQFYEGLLLP